MDKPQGSFSQDEVTAIIRRALLMQGERSEFSLQDLEEVAQQAGVASEYLREAIVHECEARDREEAKRRFARRKLVIWSGFAGVQLLLLSAWLFQIAEGNAGSGLLAGWAVGVTIGTPLVFFSLAGVEHQVFQKLQEKRRLHNTAMLARSTELPHKGHSAEHA